MQNLYFLHDWQNKMTYNITSTPQVFTTSQASFNISKSIRSGATFIGQTASNHVTFNLPKISDIQPGTQYTFKKNGGGNNVYFNPDDTDSIDGASDGVAGAISSVWDSYTIVCDENQWYTIAYGQN